MPSSFNGKTVELVTTPAPTTLAWFAFSACGIELQLAPLLGTAGEVPGRTEVPLLGGVRSAMSVRLSIGCSLMISR